MSLIPESSMTLDVFDEYSHMIKSLLSPVHTPFQDGVFVSQDEKLEAGGLRTSYRTSPPPWGRWVFKNHHAYHYTLYFENDLHCYWTNEHLAVMTSPSILSCLDSKDFNQPTNKQISKQTNKQTKKQTNTPGRDNVPLNLVVLEPVLLPRDPLVETLLPQSGLGTRWSKILFFEGSGRGCFFREDKSREEMTRKRLRREDVSDKRWQKKISTWRTYMVLVPSLIGRKAVL